MKEVLSVSFRSSLAALLLLGLLQPFGIDQVKEHRLLFILGQAICVFLCVCVSHILIYLVDSKRYDLSGKRLCYLALMLAYRFLIVALVIAAALLSFDSWFYTGSISQYWFDESGFTLRPYYFVLGQTLLVSLFIYIWMVYQKHNDNLNDELVELRALSNLLEERQEKEVVEEESAIADEHQTCLIESNTNNLKLEVNPKDIVYVESMSNYADICYIVNGETRHSTLRITMKQLRETLCQADCLVSCHRAFIINLNFIVSISTRATGGYQLQIFGTDKLIPVARSYTEEIKKRITEH